MATQHAIDFNPRPREEGDSPYSCLIFCQFISIHALVKRATLSPYGLGMWLIISIHALVKRATSTALLMLQDRQYFNPRPREEGDKKPRYHADTHFQFQSTPS